MPVRENRPPLSLRLVRFGLMALLFTPLMYARQFYYPVTASKYFFFLTIVELTFLCFLFLLYFHPVWRPKFTQLSQSLFLFIVVMGIASLLGVNPGNSFWNFESREINLILWAHLAAAFWMLIFVFRRREDWRQFFFFAMSIGWVVSLAAIAQRMGFEIFEGHTQGSTLGNSSFLGTFLLFQLIFSGYLLFDCRGKQRIFVWVSFVTFLIALFLTPANASILSFLGGGILFLALVCLSKGGIKKRIGMAVLGTLILLFIVSLVSLFFPESGITKFFIEYSSRTRFVLWDIAWKGFLERPWFGWGIENYRDLFAQFYNSCLGSSVCGGEVWFDRAHNKVLDLLVETGVVGLFSYIGIFILSFVGIWKAYRAQIIPGSICALIAAGLASYLVQDLSVFDTLTSYFYWLCLVALVSYWWTLSDRKKETTKEVKAQTGDWVGVAVGVFTLVTPVIWFFVVLQPARADIATRSAAEDRQMGTRLEAYETAVTLSSFWQDQRRSYLAAQTATVIWDAQDKEKGRVFFQKELSLSEQALRDTIKHSPMYLRAYLDLGFIYLTNARYFNEQSYGQAEEILQEALKKFPNNQFSYWALVMLYLDKTESEKAIPLAEAALNLDRRVTASHIRRYITYLLAGDEDALQKTKNETLEEYPTLSEAIERLESIDIETNRDLLLIRFYYDAGL
ncbi:O-antigen ligase family protein [Candidatus Uhrbacteria bacterium]|nr:O-antigen ligase family protein [Candidatus Uhrbacteria bacterium]